MFHVCLEKTLLALVVSVNGPPKAKWAVQFDERLAWGPEIPGHKWTAEFVRVLKELAAPLCD
jgi:hypothetical protein